MEIHPPPIPEYREAGEVATHDYRVVFWQHQLPESAHSAFEMGWAELTWDVADAEDVHEVIGWAESYLNEFAEAHPGSEHTYVLYAKVPGETWMLHIAGANRTVLPENDDFRRSHPFRDA
jgi:hypothetical protein